MSPFYRHCLAEQGMPTCWDSPCLASFGFSLRVTRGSCLGRCGLHAVLGALVIGRSQRRREAGWLNQLLQQDSGRRLLGLDLLTDIAQCVVFAFCVSGFSMDGCGVIFA